MKKISFVMIIALTGLFLISCKKNGNDSADEYTYYQVRFNTNNADWRDTAFVVRTNNNQLIQKADAQLALPVDDRQIVFGGLLAGNDGYNKNASHSFKWHINENDWELVDITAEIFDGKPYTDIDSDTAYWLNTVKRFGAWSSFISKKLPGKP